MTVSNYSLKYNSECAILHQCCNFMYIDSLHNTCQKSVDDIRKCCINISADLKTQHRQTDSY